MVSGARSGDPVALCADEEVGAKGGVREEVAAGSQDTTAVSQVADPSSSAAGGCRGLWGKGLRGLGLGFSENKMKVSSQLLSILDKEVL